MTQIQLEIMAMIMEILSKEGNETLTPVEAIYRSLSFSDGREYRKGGRLNNTIIHRSLTNYLKRT